MLGFCAQHLKRHPAFRRLHFFSAPPFAPLSQPRTAQQVFVDLADHFYPQSPKSSSALHSNHTTCQSVCFQHGGTRFAWIVPCLLYESSSNIQYPSTPWTLLYALGHLEPQKSDHLLRPPFHAIHSSSISEHLFTPYFDIC